MDAEVERLRCTARFQLKKVLDFGAAVGHAHMTPHQLAENVSIAVNMLIATTKEGWGNIKSLSIKSTMGPSISIV